MKRQTISAPHTIWQARVSRSTRSRLGRTFKLARVLTPELTWNYLLNLLMVRMGVQVRRELRQRGIDVAAELAKLDQPKVKPEFTGPPQRQTGRVYNHARDRKKKPT